MRAGAAPNGEAHPDPSPRLKFLTLAYGRMSNSWCLSYPRQSLPTPGVFPLELQPYGNLAAQAVQRFEKYEDLAGHKVGRWPWRAHAC